MKIRKYFTTNHIIEGLITAIFLSAFIYIEHFNLLTSYYLLLFNTFCALYGLYRLINSRTSIWFFSGFFLGIFWLWWMGISFIYYHLTYLVPFAIFIIALIYGFIFFIFAYISKKIAKRIELQFLAIDWKLSRIILNTISLMIINQIEPFGFNWLKLQLTFTQSIFSVNFYSYIIILVTLALFSVFKRWYILLLLILVIDLKQPKEISPKALRDIELVSTNISVSQKWKPINQINYTNLALQKIKNAVKKDKKIVILPESILPYFLNLEKSYLDKFLGYSKKITIIIGSLYFKDTKNFRNSAYIIKDGNYTVANKVVLVPFGEANPLPKFMSKIVNKIFFDGAQDYQADSNFTYISAINKKFKIAICYEGTSTLTYIDKPDFLIIISNNAWFKPSIEPTLQKILLKYYARVYKTTIYHSINGSKSYAILPHP